MFGTRKRWNNKVAALLPAFDISPTELGVMKMAESLDLVYPKGFSEHEGAFYLTYLGFGGYLSRDSEKAQKIKSRIASVEVEWIKLGRVKAKNVEMWREKAKEWERSANKP